jgi:hypothetical protein
MEHEQSKTELKSLIPEDAKEAIGHGLKAKRSKSGAVSFDLLGGGNAELWRGVVDDGALFATTIGFCRRDPLIAAIFGSDPNVGAKSK